MISSLTVVLVNAVFSGLLLALSLYRGWLIYRETKRRTYAIIVNDDLNEIIIKEVNLNKKYFYVKKQAYLTARPYIRHRFKKYLLYRSGQSEPALLSDTKESLVDAEALHSILETEHLKKLNSTGLNLFGDLSPAKLLMYAAIGGVILWAVFGRGGS